MRSYLITSACIFFAHAAFAADAPDPSSYSLFNPVPDASLRDFSTDRPGKTHSTTTVDAGHVQIESDFVNYTYDRNSPDKVTSRSLVVGAPLVKLGVTSNFDIEALFAFYDDVHAKDRTTGATQNGDGVGDISLGGKYNIFGNGDSKQSLAVVPFIKFPTGTREVGNGRAEYIVNVPYAIKLGEPWSLTLEPGAALLRNANNDNLHGMYNFAANISRPLFADNLTASLELYGQMSGQPHEQNQYTIDPALQWSITPNLALDVGAYISLNKAAPDLDAYSGISVRF